MNKFNSIKPQWQEEVDVLTLEEDVDGRKLILFNDDVNTFDHVINMLVKYCKHEPMQAEQCAYIVHYSGKCDVKNGSYEELELVCTALLDAGLSAEIQ
jgi:ATP-dependent Clp protease adaptor protein ClpS